MTQLILLPGLASDAVMWRRQLEVIPPRWKPHVTTVHSRHDTIAAMAHALLTEHTGDLVLCGASMGGIVAMEVARQAPQRLRGLALLGTNARPETPDMRRLREAAMVFFEDGRSAELLRANVPLAFHPDSTQDPELARSYLRFVLAAGPEQLIRQNRAIMERPDARAHLATLRCPVLVLCGDSDQLTPPDCSEEIAALVAHATFELVPRCGHMLTMERPEVVNRLLLDWLQTLGPGQT